MRNGLSGAALAALLAISGGSAAASPEADNPLVLIGSGTDNLLQIEQVSPSTRGDAGTEQGNRVDLHIDGDFNGGRDQAWPDSQLFAGMAVPGLISQRGTKNDVTLGVSGNHNLFSVVQAGYGNTVTGTISGTGNMAAVMQQGHGHVAHFSQTGTGNSLAVTQTSW